MTVVVGMVVANGVDTRHLVRLLSSEFVILAWHACILSVAQYYVQVVIPSNLDITVAAALVSHMEYGCND